MWYVPRFGTICTIQKTWKTWTRDFHVFEIVQMAPNRVTHTYIKLCKTPARLMVIRLCKTRYRLWGYVLWPSLKNIISSEIKKDTDACLATTGAIGGTSKEKLDKELGLVYLKNRCCFREL